MYEQSDIGQHCLHLYLHYSIILAAMYSRRCVHMAFSDGWVKEGLFSNWYFDSKGISDINVQRRYFQVSLFLYEISMLCVVRTLEHQ